MNTYRIANFIEDLKEEFFKTEYALSDKKLAKSLEMSVKKLKKIQHTLKLIHKVNYVVVKQILKYTNAKNLEILNVFKNSNGYYFVIDAFDDVYISDGHFPLYYGLHIHNRKCDFQYFIINEPFENEGFEKYKILADTLPLL